MVCNKCNQVLPDDSEFCQYCGYKVEKNGNNGVFVSKETTKMDFNGLTPELALEAILEEHAKETIKAMEENSHNQPDNEHDIDFGLVSEKPIYTLATMSVDGEKEYLNKLYTSSGEKVKWNRRGSMSVDGIHGMVDIYDIYLPSGQLYKTIYINMYGAYKSTKVPAGFIMKKSSKVHYEVVDDKQNSDDIHDKPLLKKFKKISKASIIFSVIIVVLLIINICQFVYTQNLNDDIYYMQQQIDNQKTTIDELEAESLENWMELYFYDSHAVLVNNDSNYYHKYGCVYFDESSFWIFNTEAAESKGYYPCPQCH